VWDEQGHNLKFQKGGKTVRVVDLYEDFHMSNQLDLLEGALFSTVQKA
jgi:hypothetical protein